MSFPKSAQRKGGKAAASVRQKTIAKQTIVKTKPWLKSTGPKTEAGLKVTTENVRCEKVLFYGCSFASKKLSVKARNAFVSRAKELKEHLKSQNQGFLNYLVTEVWYGDDEPVNAKFTASMRCPTPEGIETAKQWFSDKTWLL
jgi:hypothetical protein